MRRKKAQNCKYETYNPKHRGRLDVNCPKCNVKMKRIIKGKNLDNSICPKCEETYYYTIDGKLLTLSQLKLNLKRGKYDT